MIITAAECRVVLGIADSITEADRMLIELLLADAHAAIKNVLRYDPEQLTLTEFYPRADSRTWNDEGSLELSGDRAAWTPNGSFDELQLARIPVRSITEVRVDNDGRFGQRAGSFGDSTLWVAGTDYWIPSEIAGFSQSGLILSSTGWPIAPGSIRITYTAGYTAAEFSGRAGTGIDASPIRRAALQAFREAWAAAKARQKHSVAGFVPGVITGETMGSYSYSASGGADPASSGTVLISGAVQEMLEPFIHYGVQLT